MTSGQKTALSVLITVVLFGVISVLAFTELFSVLDSRFYEPAKISKINKKLESISKSYDEYIETLDSRFAKGETAYLKNPSIASFVESRPSDADAKTRAELTGTLRSETQGLLGLRVIDRNLKSIHYSTFRDDVLRENPNENIIEYKNYSDALTNLNAPEIPVSEIAVEDSGANSSKVYYDGKNGRIIFSYPFHDRYMVFRGTIVFYVNAMDFARLLAKQNLVGVGAPFDFIADSEAHGFAMGIPSVAHEDFVKPILEAWKANRTSAQKLFAIDSGNPKNKNYWIMVTSLAGKDTFVSEIFNDEVLVLPLSGRVLILLCVFATIFLVVFIVLNLRRDDMTVIRERIVTLQLGVVDEYLKRKADLNLQSITGKRAAVTKEILESLGRRGKLHRDQVEELINRSWDELLAAMNLAPKQQAQNATFSAESTEEIKNMLQEILSSGNIKVQAVGGVSSGLTTVSPSMDSTIYASSEDDVEDLDEVESLEEVEDLDEVEELGEVEELVDAEEIGGAEELGEVEELGGVEELVDAEEVDVVEDLEDVGGLEETSVEESSVVAPLETDADELTKAFDDILDSDDDLAAAVAMDPVEETKTLGDSDEITEISFEDLGDSFTADDFFGSSKPKPVHSPEEMFDISEDVSADFFAVKSTAGKKARSGLLHMAELENQYSEANDVALNFTTELPYFTASEDDFFVEGDSASKDQTKSSTGSLLARAMMIAASSDSDEKTERQEEDNDEVIRQDSDGVFSIRDQVETDNVVQDNSFKRLVDSVLNK